MIFKLDPPDRIRSIDAINFRFFIRQYAKEYSGYSCPIEFKF